MTFETFHQIDEETRPDREKDNDKDDEKDNDKKNHKDNDKTKSGLSITAYEYAELLAELTTEGWPLLKSCYC